MARGRNIFIINPIQTRDVQERPTRNLADLGGLPDQHQGLGSVDIILHLGAHRCASTTFQSYLWANRHALDRRGLTCWTPKRTRDGLMRGLIRHPETITLKDEELGFRSVNRMRVEMDRLQRDGQKALLISEENMMGTVLGNIQGARLYPLADERLLRFRPVFDDRPLKIGLAVRSYEDFWTSSLTYRLVRTGELPDEETLDKLTTQPTRWRMQIRVIAEVFPKAEIFVWAFEKRAPDPAGLLGELYDDGLPPPVAPMARRNRSPALLDLNKMQIARGAAPIQAGLLEQNARWTPFDQDQSSVLRAEYRRDIAWLKSGSEGIATYLSGQDRQTRRATTTGTDAPAHSPDRATQLRTALGDALTGGHNDGIEGRLG